MANVTINDRSRYTVDSLYQWDLNQVLYVYGLAHIKDPEIHFANSVMSASLVVLASVDGKGVISANIPNSLLQKPYDLNVFVCGYEGDTFKTYAKIIVPVKSRNKPSDYTLENDGEVYSFNQLSKDIFDLQKSLETGGGSVYSYTYDSDNVVLKEASGTRTIGEYIPLVSASLKAIKSIIDKIKNIAETALSIAKGRNQAHIFDTTEDMEAWLSDSANAGIAQKGDNLYIIDLGVPDWWISKVLTEPDSETGYYYEIAQLETQKVNLTELTEEITDEEIETIYNELY